MKSLGQTLLSWKQIFFLLLFASVFFLGCSVVAGKSRLVTGFVQSLSTDDNDNPVEIFLWDGRTEYHVEKNKSQQQLLDLVDRKVAARGSVYKDWRGRTRIDVSSFEIIAE